MDRFTDKGLTIRKETIHEVKKNTENMCRYCYDDSIAVFNGKYTVHLLCAYWGLVVMSLHIGFHFSMLTGMIRKHIGEQSTRYIWQLWDYLFLSDIILQNF